MDRVIQNKHVVTRSEGDESFLFNAETSRFIVINETARFIWDHCAEGATRGEIVALVMDEYAVDQDTATADTEEYVTELLEQDFLITRGC